MFANQWLSPFEAADGAYSKSFISSLTHKYNEDNRLKGFEQTVAGNPYNVQAWLQYVNYLNKNDLEYRLFVYLRALHANPTSYKIWMRLFRELERNFDRLKTYCSDTLDIIEATYRKGSMYLHRMPKIRLMYPRFLFTVRGQITRVRQEYNDILISLPITQHHIVWPEFISFAKQAEVTSLGLLVFSRAIQLMPKFKEDFVEYLMERQLWARAVKVLSELCQDKDFLPDKDSSYASKQEMWLKLCSVISEHPESVSLEEGERLIRMAVSRASVSPASLWCALAAFYAASSASVDACIAIFEEGLCKITTNEDFEQIYESYTSYVEETIKHLCATDDDALVRNAEADRKSLVSYLVDKLDMLTSRKEDLLALVRIQGAPHNVELWLERVQLNKDYDRCVEIFESALREVDPFNKTCERYESLWIHFAGFHDANEETDKARAILEKGRYAAFRYIDQLVAVWCESIEFELMKGEYENALHLARLSVAGTKHPVVTYFRGGDPSTFTNASGISERTGDDGASGSLQPTLITSVCLWALLFDLECSFGTSATLEATFEQMLKHKTVTIDQVHIYANRLQDANQFEKSFKAYEKALELFSWPHCRNLWLVFLQSITARIGARDLIRVRRLHEKALSGIPADEALRFYYLYAMYELEYGLTSFGLKILKDAAEKVALPDKFKVYMILIRRSAMHIGLTSTRPIYEDALQCVSDEHLMKIGVKFAKMEIALLEIERARAIFEHICQYSTAADDDVWTEWKALEVQHGNETTYASMLRKKKAVACAFTEVASQPNEEGD